jgi:hypothetical protein
MMTQIYDLAYEVDEQGDVQLEQDAGCGEVARVTLHPIHVRLLAEEAGIMTPSSNLESDRTIARLCRQLRVLHGRISQLDDWLGLAAARGHEDLDMETAYSSATWDLASEWVRDLPHVPRDESGLVDGNGPESGAVSGTNAPVIGGIAASGRAPKSKEARS